MLKYLARRRPDGVGEGPVQATGKISEALETIERARSHLYSFHQLTGCAFRPTESVPHKRLLLPPPSRGSCWRGDVWPALPPTPGRWH
ncbi:hypothetical protein BST12_05670 [Mycobacterium angelicum]|uniref:Uncharacterized protein n=1 Tax=Mycobacterium angelicum TaxID=470074 RepID=A0A1X0A2H1_MYCAN|nr:hypothetical protein BST12_05670 [Mycobacterium angelicum]